ncbi:MAG: hypothetical protein M1825_002828 [Sarcosagium campestre]|nr:MAG: hypothetical protein M1825_002828 [Sarcosagium campestre]
MKPSGRPLVSSKRSNKPKKAKRGSHVQVPTTPPRQVGKEQPTVTPGMLADMVPETPPKLASGVQERAVDRGLIGSSVEEPVDLPAASTVSKNIEFFPKFPKRPARRQQWQSGAEDTTRNAFTKGQRSTGAKSRR